jgi:hypothetical protein
VSTQKVKKPRHGREVNACIYMRSKEKVCLALFMVSSMVSS